MTQLKKQSPLTACLFLLLSLFHEPARAQDDAGSGPSDGTATGNAPFERVVERARALAEKPYEAGESPMPEALTDMSYTQYRGIRFRRDQSLWVDHSDFRVELFHPGFLYTRPVVIRTINDGQVSRVPFDPRRFRYDEDIEGLDAVAGAAADTEAAIGFAGFRVHYPINTADYQDEVIVFLGASYFRMVGRGQHYGISGRGLAIDTAAPSGEEFPAFREFWLVRPEPGDRTLTVYALLDSRSLTGAYRFDLRPGRRTEVEVTSRLFARQAVEKLGVAPLTSMFLYGENRTRYRDDFRPEVHDSDGLLVHTAAGEWLWRPLTNPPELRVSSSAGPAPSGFGLLQRDRDFDRYLDLEADYHDRPGLWVRPGAGDWGEGRVELVEIPSDSETNDNIVAYWVPDRPLAAGESRRFDYHLSTLGDGVPGHELAPAVRTRIGWGAVPGMPDPPPRSERQFIVDFRGETLARLGEGLPVAASIETSTGTVEDVTVHRLPDAQSWRAAFKLAPEEGVPADMQLHLTLRGRRLTETWNYVWYPDDLE